MDIRVNMAAAALLGFAFASSTAVPQCLALLIIPLACRHQNNVAMKLVLAFYSFACLPTLWIVHSYTGSEIVSLLAYLWLVSINAGCLCLALKQKILPRWFAVPLALTVLCIPPISQVNPLGLAPLAGWLFPGFGFLGLLCLALLVAGLAARSAYRLTSLAALVAIALPLGDAFAEQEMNEVRGISFVRAHDERLDTANMRLAYRHEERDLAIANPASTIVMPESVFGEWSPLDGSVFSTLPFNLYGGARVFFDNEQFINVIVNAKTGEAVYEQQGVPPVFRPKGAKAVRGSGAIVDVGFQALICYELTDPWIAMSTFGSSSEPVVWISNLGWFESSYLERRLQSVLIAWGRLFTREIQASVMRHG